MRFGASLDAPRLTSWLAVYAEYARAQDHVLDVSSTGGALYAALTATHGRATWLLEGKDYRGYRGWSATDDPLHTVVYQQPPTLERVQMPYVAGEGITAARLRVDFRRDDKLSLLGSLLGGQDRSPSGGWASLADAWVSAEMRWNDGKTRVAPLVEARREQYEVGGGLVDQMLSLELTAMHVVSGAWSLEANGFVWLRDKGGTVPAWREGVVQVAVHRAPDLIFTAGYEFTTEKKEQLNQHNFFNASARWNIRSDTYVSLFVGGNRPGLRCASGLCRVFPAFQGVRLEVVAQY